MVCFPPPFRGGTRLTMDIAKHLSHRFLAQSRARGRDYFEQERVELRYHDEARVEAVVHGTDAYFVRLERTADECFLSCTCPHFDDGYPCKHIWATLLAVESEPSLGDWRELGARRPVFEEAPGRDRLPHGDPDEDTDLLDDDEEEAAFPAEPSFNRERERRAYPAPVPVPRRTAAWHSPIERVRTAMVHGALGSDLRIDSAPAPHIVYLVDATASVANGELILVVAQRERKRNGDWTRPRPARLRRSALATLPDEADRRILASLVGASQWHAGSAYFGELPSKFMVPPELAVVILPTISDTGRLLITDEKSGQPGPLHWGGQAPWRFRLVVSPLGEGALRRYAVGGELFRGEESLPVTAPRLVTLNLVFFTDTVECLDHGGAWAWIPELRRHASFEVPASQAGVLLSSIFSLPRVPRISLPEELQVETVELAPIPHLQLTKARGWVRPHVAGRLSFDYRGTTVSGTLEAGAIYLPEKRRLIPRQPAMEQDARQHLHRLGFREQWHDEVSQGPMMIEATKIPRVVGELTALGWRVEAEGRLYRPPRRSTLAVKSGIDWFELHGQVEFGDQIADLPELLRALARGERFITLDDGSLGLLPEDWLRRFAGLTEFGETADDHVRFRQTQVALLDALLAAEPEADFDETFERARAALPQFDHIEPADPPASFAGTLRGYQREGLGWLQFLRRFGFGGCLADDMGLGKTVMVLALLEQLREQVRYPSLVVAPRSVVFNWLREAEHFTPLLRVADYTGPDRAQLLERLDQVDLLVTTYGTVRQDIAVLKEVAFEYVVLDESQAIKNASTASAKSARLLKGRHRLALSGTPVENHLGELWSLFDFLNPGMFGTRHRVRGAGAAKASQAAQVPHTPRDENELSILARALRPFILRRTKQQVAQDLPERQEETIWCELEGHERRWYEELRDHYKSTLLGSVHRRGLGRSKLQVLEALLRLRQAACHPGLLDATRAGGSSAKLDALLPQLLEVRDEGHKALVFSQFTSLLAIVRRHLDEAGLAYEYLDGQTRNREERVRRFQEDEDCQLFLISLKAGGLGLNLTAADYVFLLDPWWNPAAEAQAIDRAHRIGQTRPVFAYRLIARNTVEERILDLQRQKRDLADAIITADNSIVANLTREELEMLLS